MKGIKKISLVSLNQSELTKKQQQLIFGGNACRCGSCGATATDSANKNANYDGGITGTGTNDPSCKCDGVIEFIRGSYAI
ncbi:MAG: TIGR04149 family rSAM-modified RiPP [Roseburia sp.]|nr:TIGR04149 family rSAM-modified RiPP [Roseburia sp.]MCM1419867.1 TIGR04149 family rSAM-modified RiPP [Bacteroides sp.]